MPVQAPAATPEQLALSGVAECKAWIARLPAGNATQRHALLLAQSQAVSSSAVAPATKLEILELLREPVAIAQAALAKDCRGKPLPLAARDGEAWESMVALW